MRDSAFFSRDIRDLSSKLGREAGIKITSGSGISCFHGVGIRDSQREQSGIRDFNPSFRVPLKPWSSRRHFFSHFASFRVTHDKLGERGLSPKLTSAKTARWQKRTYCAYSCVSGNAFIRKKTSSEPNFQECKDAKSFEINCHVCLRAIFLSLKRKERKE